VLKIFGGRRPDHPMADIKEARKILEDVPANDAFKALDELSHWLDSVRTAEGFEPQYRAELVQLIDESAQNPLRKLSRDYLATPRLSKFQEGRLWGAICEFWRQSALAFVACVDLYASGAKGANALKPQMPLLTLRSLRALAAQLKWQYVRYGPVEDAAWGTLTRIYAVADSMQFAQTKTTVYASIPGMSSPEQEFLKALMLSASSPDGLLPLEIELAERLVAHYSGGFTLGREQQSGIAYWIDLASGHPPLRLTQPPAPAPTLRFFAAGKAQQELERLIENIKVAGAVPASVNLGGAYEPEIVLPVLEHLAMYWSSKSPERQSSRHRVKSRLTMTYGFDGVLAAIAPEVTLDFDDNRIESWIVDNVSSGGFGAVVPQIKGDWLRIGALLGLQPEGGSNWVIGVIRRLNRSSLQQATVGIQTLARQAQVLQLRLESGSLGKSRDTETGILLDAVGGEGTEVSVLLRAGAWVAGQNMEYEHNGDVFLLLPAGVEERGGDYERVRFRRMVRDTGE
jgi:hypothetical protein